MTICRITKSTDDNLTSGICLKGLLITKVVFWAGCAAQHLLAHPFAFGITLALLFVCVPSSNLLGNDGRDSLLPDFRIEGATRFAVADHLGQVYRITTANGIEKYSPEGKMLVQYTGQREGRADYLDVVNPMKILVWYRDFRTVVILDRNLTVLGSMNFMQAGFPEVKTVASSRDGHLWIYDEVLFRLIKVTQEGAVLYQGPHLGQWYDRQVRITHMEESDTRLYAMDSNYGLLVFDAFGQPRGAFPMQERPIMMDVQRDIIWYTAGSDLVMWRADVSEQVVRRLPTISRPGSWVFSEGKLMHVGQEGLTVFPLPKPE